MYTAILCDTVARHKRMCGFNVVHLRDVDMHGVNVKDSNEPLREEPARTVLRNWHAFEEFSRLAEIGYTNFSWVSSPEHIHTCQTLLQRIMRYSPSTIYRAKYEGRYCIQDRIVVSDSPEPANCALCNRPAGLVSEDRYFFRLSAFQDRLAAIYKYHPEFLIPHCFVQEIENAKREGLRDISISRKSKDGIPWPDDPDQIVDERYAALAIYLSGIGFATEEMQLPYAFYGTEHRLENDQFKEYWPPNLHVIGREALWVHAIYWPALLIAGNLPVPRHILTHGTLRSDQHATNNALLPETFLQALGGEVLRYCLLREVGYGTDAEISLPRLVSRYHEDLIGGLAKLVERVLTLVVRHYDSKIPAPSLFSDFGSTMESSLFELRADVRFLFDHHNFHEGLAKIWSLIPMIRKTLEENTTPESELESESAKKVRGTNAIYDACQGLGWITLLLHPVLPRTTDAIWKSLGQTTSLENPVIDDTPLVFLIPGTPVGPPPTLFPLANR